MSEAETLIDRLFTYLTEMADGVIYPLALDIAGSEGYSNEQKDKIVEACRLFKNAIDKTFIAGICDKRTQILSAYFLQEATPKEIEAMYGIPVKYVSQVIEEYNRTRNVGTTE